MNDDSFTEFRAERQARTRGYARIEDHGVVGDLNTVALIDLCGTIDFLCWPRFDSPTIFSSLLDAEKGGRFSITPRFGDGARHKQIYLPETNVLVTRTLAQDGLAEITDLMPMDDGPQRLLRIVRSVRSSIEFDATCAPRFDYARARHRLDLSEDRTIGIFHPEKGDPLRLIATVPLREADGDVTATFALDRGQTATFLLETFDSGAQDLPCGLDGFGTQCFDQTVAYWRGWTAQSTYEGRWRETVQRSALILKLLSSRQHGSLIAAPTFALPEVVGGGRNWDYRYAWIRDAAFTLYSLIRLGYTAEAQAFVDWIEDRIEADDEKAEGQLQVLYGVDGGCELEEKMLDHLDGYRGSRPVRIGNGAAGQLQLDIYGALMDAVYLANKYGCPISHDAWAFADADRELGRAQLGTGRRGDLGISRRPTRIPPFSSDVLGMPRPGVAPGPQAVSAGTAFGMGDTARPHLQQHLRRFLVGGTRRLHADQRQRSD